LLSQRNLQSPYAEETAKKGKKRKHAFQSPSRPAGGTPADMVTVARPESASPCARADVALLYAPPVYIYLRERAPITVQSERSDDYVAR